MATASLSDAIAQVRETYPFKGYIGGSRVHGVYPVIAEALRKHLPDGGRVLDVGAGGCDTACVLSLLGYEVAAYDDFQDTWHVQDDNWKHVVDYAQGLGVDARRITDFSLPLPWQPESFDLVMAHDVIEHLHDSPKAMVESLLALLKPGGMLMLTVPNAASILKRLRLLRGKTNMPDFGYFYWSGPPWRGHVREYVRDDLQRLARYAALQIAELRGVDTILMPASVQRNQALWNAMTAPMTGLRSSWLMLAIKAPGSAPMVEPPDEPMLRFWKQRMQRRVVHTSPGVSEGSQG